MKKTVLFLFVTMFAVSSLFAQQRQRATPEQRAERQTETLVKELGLDDKQKEKVYEISLKFAQPSKSESTDREKRREEFRKKMEERNAAIKALLTEEQQKKFEEHLKNAQNRPQGRRGAR